MIRNEYLTKARTTLDLTAQQIHDLGLSEVARIRVEMEQTMKRSSLKGTLPRFRHGIIPVPAALAPIYTGGRGGLEACQMNTYNLPAGPRSATAHRTLATAKDGDC